MRIRIVACNIDCITLQNKPINATFINKTKENIMIAFLDMT